MANSDEVFQPLQQTTDDATRIRESIRCIEAFTERFNARDLPGMDALLHFPHIILSGEHLVIWNEPGNLTATFFDDLIREVEWSHSVYQRKDVVLVSPRKVHLLVEYTRNRADGSVISSHSNLWIVTFDEGRWGIKQRSY